LYVGVNLVTSMCEVFGETREALFCPRWRVAILQPTDAAGIDVFDLTIPGSAMAIGALPALADGALPRALTQQWARAVYEQQPTYPPTHAAGIRYRSAYNGDLALAIWDTAGGAAITTVSAAGVAEDLPLNDPRIQFRVQTQLLKRRIDMRVIDSSACSFCDRDPFRRPTGR
jgi:hypothetical protein